MSDFASKLAAVTGKKPPAGNKAGGSGPAGPPQTVRIQDPNRAGRAPYNFVPPPATTHWLTEAEQPPKQDRATEGLLSGSIEIELRALTKLFVRGTVDLQEYVKSADGDKKPQSPLPFQVNQALRLPGSSLRGMVRSLVEIMGEAPLDPIDDAQLFFRTVGSISTPGGRGSFEPHAVAYKSRIDAIKGTVKVGYLTGHRDDGGWTIVPAQVRDGRQCYKVPLQPKWSDLRGDAAHQWKRPRDIWFKPGRLPSTADFAETEQPGYEPGWLVCTGVIAKKRHQWVLRPKNDKAQAIKVPEWDVAAYRESGITPALESHGFVYSRKSADEPCFYVEWTGPEGKQHISFGHTYHFRLPYEHSVAQAVPEANRRARGETRWDLAQAIFGRTSDEVNEVGGARGRVFFEDAVLAAGPQPGIEPAELRVVLGQPKPTTFQHYLIQTREDVVNSIHWDGNYQGQGKAAIRGSKLYFHRPGAPIPPSAGKERVESRMRPAREGCVFTARIRFDQLRPWELGALLTALELTEGCAHRLGMAKPLGLGSLRVTVSSVSLIDWARRYSRVCIGPTLDSGVATAAPERRAEWKHRFADWVRPGSTPEQLWQTPRWTELKALLTYDSLPADWANRTRYLEFGKTAGNPRVDYNEYKHVGFPRLENGRPAVQQRRPLPPASQVATDPRLPSDAVPQFEKRGERDN